MDPSFNVLLMDKETEDLCGDSQLDDEQKKRNDKLIKILVPVLVGSAVLIGAAVFFAPKYANFVMIFYNIVYLTQNRIATKLKIMKSKKHGDIDMNNVNNNMIL